MKTLIIAILAVSSLASCSKKKPYCYRCVVTKNVYGAYDYKLIRAATDTSVICEASETDISNFIATHMMPVTKGDSTVYSDCNCVQTK